ncbi:MAG: hypothetical protein A2X87_02035 [Deltaproteobacteria bacterium GWC2_42_51]|nr:MAG: hypothetical protein A2X87_02035 [Deltaproteobacteria bacterium GWC2_42_51]OGP46759.1 MAG: hypothetical protein A2022_00520 [Deltaproteobacteria bacterium GWF2_42_12]OGQ29988.1 MAG: hypothetical protein A3D29_06440 [Deltaproteobacteria bacterium RIFCSPHIGHO2_02_FULL_42_44]OGQ67193.1 MAG: hypothetical protein A3F88_06890 [Deltaproteobacteria bacterium RIFCSPLOWO2_12_FULL_42_16]HBG93370.1 hypothetical protein [Nitrospiraceae bacterium]
MLDLFSLKRMESELIILERDCILTCSNGKVPDRCYVGMLAKIISLIELVRKGLDGESLSDSKEGG